MDWGEVEQRSRNAARWLGWALLVVVAVGPAVFLWQALVDEPAKGSLAQCREAPARRAAPVEGAIELQTNRARPTLAIALADNQTAVDTIAFSTKERRVVSDVQGSRVSAVMLETPRRSAAEPYDGKVSAKAEPVVGGTVVLLTVCVDRGAALKAGAFQGTVRVFGPQVGDFDYAVIVTEKWPWQVAVATLWYAGLAFVIVAWRTGSLTFGRDRHWVSTVAGIAFGLLAMVPAFFGAYWNNATWGSDPGTHVTGLATAGFTAALAGLAAAQRVLAGSSGRAEEVATDEEMEAEPGLEPEPDVESEPDLESEPESESPSLDAGPPADSPAEDVMR